MKKICKIILIITLISISIAEIKIGYIDSQVIMNQYEDVRQVQVKLEKEQKRLESLYTKKVVSYDSLEQALQTSSIILSKDKIKSMENKLIDKQKITPNSTPDLKKQPVIKTKPNSGSNKPDLMNNISITENDNYQLEDSMATFSMVGVLRSQKHYQQALAILKTLETTKADLKRIHKERSEIKLLIKKTLIQ